MTRKEEIDSIIKIKKQSISLLLHQNNPWNKIQSIISEIKELEAERARHAN
jgi:hypothetical protein